MKVQIYAKIVGHSLWRPDPKNEPQLELVRAKLELQPKAKSMVKPSAGVLIIEREDAGADFILGRQLRITIEDTQQEMELAPRASKRNGRSRRGRRARASGPSLLPS